MMHKQLIDLYKKYLFLGGMPEVIKTYVETNNVQMARIKQNEIVDTYLRDMTKYNSKPDYGKTVMTYNCIPINLAKENKKFMYSSIKKSARAKDYENATEWIALAGIGNKIFKVNQIKVPLDAYRDNERPHVHFHFIPRYKNELKIFNKVYKDRHFGYNFWKWALSRFKSQKDIFTKEERIKIFEMMKEEFDLNNLEM